MSNTFAKYQTVGKNFDALSIPGYVIKKNLHRGSKHGASERQRMCYKAKDMLQKARQPKHGGYKTNLKRWHNDDQYRKSLSEIGCIEEQIVQYDELALENHSYIATRGERDRNEKSWVFKLNKEGCPGPTNQRPDFVEAKREMKGLHDEFVKETSEGNTPIHPVQRSNPTRSSSSNQLEQHDDWKSNKSWNSWRSSSWTEQL